MHLLKEWNVVCDALGEGRQILLARKGGILDDDGRFTPSHPEFYLFPTFLHEKEQLTESLKPSEIRRLDRLPSHSPASGTLSLRFFCRMTDAVTVTDPARLGALYEEYVWNPRFLEKRLEWGSEKNLTLLIVRVYRTGEVLTLPMKPSYAGCKSWVETPDSEFSPLTPALTPVLSEEAFSTKREKILRALL